MLKYGNKEFRNLQEQVLANMRNIEDIIKGQPIMAKYTIKIVGAVEDATKLPDPLTYKGDLGDIYVVGTKSPYNLYVFGKQYENEDAPSWIDLGAIWVEGPQGETGPQGPQGPQGEKGDQGDSATITVGTTTTGAAGSDASVTNSGTASAAVLNFTIPQGIQGVQGPKGETGLGVPEIQSGDAGKALIVNPGETDAEWTTLPSSLPDIESGDAGKLLAVNSQETDAEWVTDNSLKPLVSAPAEQVIVGINTSNQQNSLTVGEGLYLDGTSIKNKEVITINADFPSTSSSGTITLDTTLASWIASNKPIINLKFNDNKSATLTHLTVSARNYIYSGLLDGYAEFMDNILYDSSGNGVTSRTYMRIQLEIYISSVEINTSGASYSRKNIYLVTGTRGNIGLKNNSQNFNLSSGSTITQSNYKKLFQAGIICKINNVLAYPIYIDNSEIRYFSIDRDSSGNFVQTIYVIDESTWVITFYTKTIA